MFISEFQNKGSLHNVMSEIYKNGDAKKASFKRLPELLEMSGNKFKFFWPIICLLVCLFVMTESL